MRALLQRVSRAAVRVNGETRPIGAGIVLFLGVGAKDDEALARKLAEKIAGLRIFSNDEGKFDRSLIDVKGEALIVSQFTLYGDCSKGRRPEFTGAMAPGPAQALYLKFVDIFRSLGPSVKTGEFGAKMEVELVNDGPVTLWLDTEKL